MQHIIDGPDSITTGVDFFFQAFLITFFHNSRSSIQISTSARSQPLFENGLIPPGVCPHHPM